MRPNRLIYVIAALVIFFIPYGVAKATNVWSTSGKFDGSGTPITVTGKDPAEIKGWMTLGEVADGYGVTIDEMVKEFKLDPAAATPDKALNKLENENFSVTGLRAWLDAKKAALPK